MLSNIVGALIGREVERRRRESGLKGAVIGAASVALLRRLGPVGMAIGGAYTAKKMWDRSKASKAGSSTVR
ncbi:hypothetical protein [uncultured Sphingomonas sp.]|uniref:hypothetical protein n=1 Tax=uncultured Sphingomonas sp. TaxID=158754 RepID=UPI0025D9525C|nr:hypothetical protein [uncultured Sphingomonas sp.]